MTQSQERPYEPFARSAAEIIRARENANAWCQRGLLNQGCGGASAVQVELSPFFPERSTTVGALLHRGEIGNVSFDFLRRYSPADEVVLPTTVTLVTTGKEAKIPSDVVACVGHKTGGPAYRHARVGALLALAVARPSLLDEFVVTALGDASQRTTGLWAPVLFLKERGTGAAHIRLRSVEMRLNPLSIPQVVVVLAADYQ